MKEDSIVGARVGKLETRKEFQFQTLTGRPPRITLYGMVIKKRILSKYGTGTKWIYSYLVRNQAQWRATVDVLMNSWT